MKDKITSTGSSVRYVKSTWIERLFVNRPKNGAKQARSPKGGGGGSDSHQGFFGLFTNNLRTPDVLRYLFVLRNVIDVDTLVENS